MIIRKALNNYKRTNLKNVRTERQDDDFDFSCDGVRFYVLAKGEWMRLHKSLEAFGPSVVTTTNHHGMSKRVEYEVNDPFVWAYVRRLQSLNLLTKENMEPGTINCESDMDDLMCEGAEL